MEEESDRLAVQQMECQEQMTRVNPLQRRVGGTIGDRESPRKEARLLMRGLKNVV
jgi:hypothetical protein